MFNLEAEIEKNRAFLHNFEALVMLQDMFAAESKTELIHKLREHLKSIKKMLKQQKKEIDSIVYIPGQT